MYTSVLTSMLLSAAAAQYEWIVLATKSLV